MSTHRSVFIESSGGIFVPTLFVVDIVNESDYHIAKQVWIGNLPKPILACQIDATIRDYAFLSGGTVLEFNDDIFYFDLPWIVSFNLSISPSTSEDLQFRFILVAPTDRPSYMGTSVSTDYDVTTVNLLYEDNYPGEIDDQFFLEGSESYSTLLSAINPSTFFISQLHCKILYFTSDGNRFFLGIEYQNPDYVFDSSGGFDSGVLYLQTVLQKYLIIEQNGEITEVLDPLFPSDDCSSEALSEFLEYDGSYAGSGAGGFYPPAFADMWRNYAGGKFYEFDPDDLTGLVSTNTAPINFDMSVKTATALEGSCSFGTATVQPVPIRPFPGELTNPNGLSEPFPLPPGAAVVDPGIPLDRIRLAGVAPFQGFLNQSVDILP